METFKENALRVIAVVGLIALLLLGAWGIIQLAFIIPGLFSNTSSGVAKTQESSTLPSAAPSSTAYTATTPAKPAAAPVKTTATTPGTRYVAAGRTTNLYGYPDLSVTITSNLGTGVRAGSRVALQFVIQNTGTNTVPQGWVFSASLPYSPSPNNMYTFTSGAQQTLYPGDKIVYTLGYDAQYQGSQYAPTNGCAGWSYPCTPNQAVYGGPGTCNNYGPCNVPGYAPNVYGYVQPGYNLQTASVTVDPYNLVWELSKANNYASISYPVY